MPTIRRLFGVIDDTNAGGSEYDQLTSGAVPDASIFWPVTGGTFDRNTDTIDRNDEVRGVRAMTAGIPYRAAPVLTVPVPAYRSVFEKLLKKTLGGADAVVAGTGPNLNTYTHTLGILGFGNVSLPALHAQLVRDDLNHKIAGCTSNRISLTAPLDGEATLEAELWGKYYMNDPAAPPTAAFTGLSANPLMLRDAQMFIDGSGTAVPDLTQFEFSFQNNLTRHWFAKRDVVTQSIGTPAIVRKLHFPAENRVSAGQEVTYAFNLASVNAVQELALSFGQIQKFVVELAGDPIGATAVAELVRITIYAGEHSGTGADALVSRDDITSRFEGNAFYSATDAADVKIEVVNGLMSALT
jgi:hypothetical protein